MKKKGFFTYFIRGLLIVMAAFFILSMAGMFLSEDAMKILSYVKIVGGILGVFVSALISIVLANKNK